jgi:SulP family sulfate permease
MIAILEARRAHLLDLVHLSSNLLAGLIVGIVALPLAMAFAIASGVKPEQGIYTAIIAGATVSLFGGCRIQIAGPTGAFVVILAGIVAKYGVDGLMLATLMGGLILILFGIARLGAVIRFIPDPVISGFTAGIGVIIWVGQWRDFFGLPAVAAAHFHQLLWHSIELLPHLNIATTALALGSLLLTVYGPKVPGLKRVPGPLLAMVAATALQSLFAFHGVATIGSAFGGVPQGLPHFAWPQVTLDKVQLLLPAAFTIALLGAIESLLSAAVADGMAGTQHNSNQELIGQGIANVLSPLFGGIAATGAIARTATNFRNGATSPLAGLTHSLVLALVLLSLAPLAGRIPLCALAAILFVVAWNMSDLKHVLRIAKIAPRADVVILLVTFALTVFTDLIVAVNIGVILALLQFLRRMSGAVEVSAVTDESLAREVNVRAALLDRRDLMVFVIEGPLFFGAVESLERALKQIHGDPQAVVFRLQRVPFMDITGLQALSEALESLERRGVKTFLSDANQRVRTKLQRAELLQRADGSSRYLDDLAAGLRSSAPGHP